jgi:cell division protease FtsH
VKPGPILSIWYIAFVFSCFIVLQTLWARSQPITESISYSDFQTHLKEGRIAQVTITSDQIEGIFKEPVENGKKHFVTNRVDTNLANELRAQNVKFSSERTNFLWASLLSWILPLAVLFALWVFMLGRVKQKGGIGSGSFMTIGKSKAKIYLEKDIHVTFADVAGIDEAKAELQEVVEFLKTPEKFRRLGGKIPKGLLLIGPPGTGKTLLARAVAGEAGVPFFSISGSEFVEMFVGVGAARVRDLFVQAREKAPCIIFIDELDALGKARGMGPIGHEEREQTLNQLLVEMDGFDPRVGIILMAATNRPEILDQALLRGGRFDRQVLVDRPDKRGRLAILQIHARGVPLALGTNLENLAAMTAGFAGADLANVINEGALLAARRGRDQVGIAELQEAVERVVAGLEKKNRVLTSEEKARVAHHEVGHALIALSLPGGSSTVQKISIIPRGVAALGYTLQVPTEDRFLMTKGELENKIAILLGGRVAEELIFNDISTGASDDLLKATEIAKNMVKTYGMSEFFGQVSLDDGRASTFLQNPQASHSREYSETTAREVDAEIRRIIETQYARATQILSAQQNVLRTAVALLLQKETISGAELKSLLFPTNGQPHHENLPIAMMH